jgi:hypothetical protein
MSQATANIKTPESTRRATTGLLALGSSGGITPPDHKTCDPWLSSARLDNSARRILVELNAQGRWIREAHASAVSIYEEDIAM